nr:ATPase, T2SS/T4P/T4SS family [Methylorubrum populi]
MLDEQLKTVKPSDPSEVRAPVSVPSAAVPGLPAPKDPAPTAAPSQPPADKSASKLPAGVKFVACVKGNGIVIVSGPTGSGKSTTLHATERELDRLDLAVYSVEDPVEYQLPFISQVQVNIDKGMDFKNAIRSFLRMDPDVIILGEVRDEETARMAVRAAETGHMVFITLHATDVRGVFSRMEDLGVSKTNLKGLCRGVMVQSLVRTLCTKCEGAGCHHCHGAGYAGRTVVSECVAFSDDREIERAIEGQIWWPRQIDDAIGKAVSGITDIDEVRRYFGAQVDIWEERNGPVPPRGGTMPPLLAPVGHGTEQDR